MHINQRIKHYFEYCILKFEVMNNMKLNNKSSGTFGKNFFQIKTQNDTIESIIEMANKNSFKFLTDSNLVRVPIQCPSELVTLLISIDYNYVESRTMAII